MKLHLLALLLLTGPLLQAKENDSTKTSRIEFGLSAGKIFATDPSARSGNYDVNVAELKNKLNKLTGTFSIGYNFKHFTIGASASAMSLSYIVDPFAPMVDGTSTQTFAPLIPAQLFARGKYTSGDNECYAGLSAGIVLPYKTYTIAGWVPPSYGKGRGTIVGLHVGDTYHLNKHIGLNAELNVNFMSLKAGDFKISTLSFPLTAGIRYRL